MDLGKYACEAALQRQQEEEHQKKLKVFLNTLSEDAMMGVIERAITCFARGQGIYNAMNYFDYEPIYSRDVSFVFDIMREKFLKPKPMLEEGEPSPLGGIGECASAIWMKWYRDKHGVSLSESREQGIKRRAEFEQRT